MGAGSIGLMVLQGVKACGAKTILIDLSAQPWHKVGKDWVPIISLKMISTIQLKSN